VKERPILFSGPMIRAILEGRKTVTRRVMKPQPFYDREAYERNIFPGKKNGAWIWQPKQDTFWFYWDDWSGFDARISRDCPHGQPGDLLWVRETFAVNIPGCPNGLTYRADHITPAGDGPASPVTWKPSIHMPRWACRIVLEITGVRVERLQEISEADCCAELGAPTEWTGKGAEPYGRDMKTAFAYLWNSLAKPGYSWQDNPWVWAITFKRLEGV
jgi:hypothetical protein